jgi:hypothetical protein
MKLQQAEAVRRSLDLAHSAAGLVVAGMVFGTEVAIIKWDHLAGVLIGTQALPIGSLATLYGVDNWLSAFSEPSVNAEADEQ